MVPVVFLGLATMLPFFKTIKEKVAELNNAILVFVYTVCFILLFRCISKKTIDIYYYIFVPLSLVASSLVLKLALSTDFLQKHNFNVDYERIKMIIVNFCFLAIVLTYYSINPGDLIGSSLVQYVSVVIYLINFIGFLYLFCLYGIPYLSKIDENHKVQSDISVASLVLFVSYVALAVSAFYTNSDLVNNADAITVFSVFSLIIVVLLSFIITSVPLFQDALQTKDKISVFLFYRTSLMYFLGALILALFASFIGVTIYNLAIDPSTANITMLVFNIFFFVMVLGFIWKEVISTKVPPKPKSPFSNLVQSGVVYITCFAKDFLTNEYKITTMTQFYVLAGVISLFLVGYTFQEIVKMINIQGGNLLLSDVVNTNSLTSVSTYADMNNDEAFHYKYAISFWVYLNSFNTNISHMDKFNSLLSYGGKPNVLYNGHTNTLLITMKDTEFRPDFVENLEKHENNVIVYKKIGMQLQKWNSIVINYDGGTLDIFVNNDLVKSIFGIVPYMSLDNLTVGENSGVNTNLTNVVYYKRPLSASNVDYMYGSMKDKDVPSN